MSYDGRMSDFDVPVEKSTKEKVHDLLHGRYAQCQKLGADGKQCPMPGIWRPVLCLPPPLPHSKEPAIRAILGLCICTIHKDYANARDFLTDESFARISAAVQSTGKIAPDRDRAWLEWRKLA